MVYTEGMRTKITPMRLTEDDIAVLDALKDKLGLLSRTEVIRMALRRLADAEGVVPKATKTKATKTKATKATKRTKMAS